MFRANAQNYLEVMLIIKVTEIYKPHRIERPFPRALLE